MMLENRFAGVSEFVASARLGSFTTAAATLGLTKSAVSKSISKLEERLGVRLFHRTTRKLALTADGHDFLGVCSSMIASFDRFEDAVGEGSMTPTGRLRVDLPSAFGRLYIVPILIEFLADFPGMSLSATFTDRRTDLIEQGIDIAIRIGVPPDTTELVARQIGIQTLVVCASPDYIERYGAPQSKDDLHMHRCIVGRRNQTRHAWLLRTETGVSERFPIVPYHELEDGQAMLEAAVAGLGVAQLPTWLAHAEFASGKLVPVLGCESGGDVPINAMWIQGAHLPLRTRKVIDRIAERLASHPALVGSHSV